MHVLNLIWFGYIARLFLWGEGKYFPRSNDFYLPSLPVEDGGGGGDRHPVRMTGTAVCIFFKV